MTKIALEAYDHIVWDWNGTLLDDADLCVVVNNEMLRDHALPELTVERYRGIFGFPIRDYYRELGFDFAHTSFEDLAERYVATYDARAKTAALHASATDILTRVRAGGKIQSILTAASEPHVVEMVAHFDLAHFFDHVFGIDDRHAASKVDRGFDLMAQAAMAGSAPGRTLLIGDTDHDFEVGEALGVDVLLIAQGHQSFERLSDLHHNVWRSLDEAFG